MAGDTNAELPAALSEMFVSLLEVGASTPWAAARAGDLVGLEHEYVVRSGPRVLDFRELIGTLDVPGRRLDPGDVNALRCRWGGVITADGAEAEIATPPVPRAPGFVGRLEAHASMAATALGRALPGGASLNGYSTHLNVATPFELTLPAAELFVAAFAPGLMLLSDRADSPGLLVRPRPGRLELGTEYIDGEARRAAIAYVTGAVLAIARVLRSRHDWRGVADESSGLPPLLAADAVATADRAGWGLRRTAYGPDLLLVGRGARLVRADGRSITAQGQLEAAWAVARAALGRSAAPRDVEAADRLVFGGGTLPIESPGWSAAVRLDDPEGPRADSAPGHVRRSSTARERREVGSSPFGSILDQRTRAGLVVTAEIATWDTTVFSVRNAVPAARTAYAAVPRASLRRFLDRLDGGHLDGLFTRYLSAPQAGRVLAGWAAALRPGLYDALTPAATFIAPEAGYALSSASAAETIDPTATPIEVRPGKREVEVPPRTGDTGGGIPLRWLFGGGALLIVLLLVTAMAVGLVRGSGQQSTLAPPPSSTPAQPVVETPATDASPTPGIVTATPVVPPTELTFPGHVVFDGCIAIDPQGNTTVLSAVFTLFDPAPGLYQARFATAPGGPLAGTGSATNGGNPVVIPMRATQFGTYDGLQLTAPDGRPIDLGPLARGLPLLLNAQTDQPNGCGPSSLTAPTPRTLAGLAYLADVAPVNVAAADFASRLASWTDATTVEQAQADAAPLLAAFRTIHIQLLGLAAAYPEGAGAMRAADDAVTRLIADLERLSDLRSTGRAAWTATWTADLASLRAASNGLRAALGLPATGG